MKFLMPLLLLGVLIGCADSATRNSQPATRRIPVILDTDIGNDIDDTWALVMLLRSPQFDVKLITTTDGQPEYRAGLVAKLLTIAGRIDIPIALGPAAGKPKGDEREASWLGTFRLDDYKGTVHRDAPRAIIETINASKEPVTVIAIGPLQTLAATLDRDPAIAPRANLVGMQGSVFKGYGGKDKPDAEFNVKVSIPSAQKVLSAPWRSIAITPLDTCGLPGVSISGDDYASLTRSSDPMIRGILDSYAAWSHSADPAKLSASTVLFDTVAIYLADPDHPLLQIQSHPIAVTADGHTIIAPESGREMSVATGWVSLPGYRHYLLRTLLSR